MTELAGINMSEMSESPDVLAELYREDAVGLMPGDRTALSWKYSMIYEVYGVEAIEELAQLDHAERFVRRNEMWQGVIAQEREKRVQKPRRPSDF